MRRLIILSATCALLITFTASFASSRVAGDLDSLQGKWTAVNKMPGGSIRIVIEVKGNVVYTTIGEGPSRKPNASQQVTLDETTTPKQISFTKGQNLSVDAESLAAKIQPPDIKGVYELTDDTFTVCTNVFDSSLPKTVGPGKYISMSVYKRGELSERQMKVLMAQAPNAKVAAPKVVLAGDLLALQGVWRNKSGQINAPKEVLTIEGDMLFANASIGRGPEIRYTSRIKLDETSSPKAIDFLNPSVRNRKNLKPEFGIYELDGDTLKIHKSGVGRNRANVFEDGAEQGNVSVWTRVAAGRNSNPTATAKRQSKAAMPIKAAAVPAQSVSKLKRATVGKATKDYSSLTIDGAEVRIYRDEPHAATFDIAGRRLPNSSAVKMLQEGNIVDVDFFAKDPAHPYYLLSEIHLIQGEMK